MKYGGYYHGNLCLAALCWSLDMIEFDQIKNNIILAQNNLWVNQHFSSKLLGLVWAGFIFCCCLGRNGECEQN